MSAIADDRRLVVKTRTINLSATRPTMTAATLILSRVHAIGFQLIYTVFDHLHLNSLFMLFFLLLFLIIRQNSHNLELYDFTLDF